jgi:hypothetical protein
MFVALAGDAPSVALTASERLARSGLVFQFPERHFLAGTLQEVNLSPLLLPRGLSPADQRICIRLAAQHYLPLAA